MYGFHMASNDTMFIPRLIKIVQSQKVGETHIYKQHGDLIILFSFLKKGKWVKRIHDIRGACRKYD